MNYLFLCLFWIGVFCIVFRNKESIRKTKSALLNYVKEQSKNSKAVNSYRQYRKKLNTTKLTKELADSLSYVNNIMILGQNKGVSVDVLLSELSDYSDKLKSAFLDMAHYLNINEKKLAADCLGSLIGSQIAYDVGRFLAGWEDLPPEDIADSLAMYRDSIRNELDTQSRQRNEIVSDLVFFPVVINCMLILLNFVYIAYFLEQKEALSILF